MTQSTRDRARELALDTGRTLAARAVTAAAPHRATAERWAAGRTFGQRLGWMSLPLIPLLFARGAHWTGLAYALGVLLMGLHARGLATTWAMTAAIGSIATAAFLFQGSLIGVLGFAAGLFAGWMFVAAHLPRPDLRLVDRDAPPPARPRRRLWDRLKATLDDDGRAPAAAPASVEDEAAPALPPADLLVRAEPPATANGQTILATADHPEVAQRAAALREKLSELGVGAHVTDHVRGPAVTRFAVELDPSTKVSAFEGLTKDIALALGTPDIRLVVPIPGRSAIGVEVPNVEREPVLLGNLSDLVPADAPPLMIPFGRSLDGEPVLLDLAALVHLLLGGTTGSGKSVLLNAIVTALLHRNYPDRLQLLIVDPSRVELVQYAGVPHLLEPVVTDPAAAVEAFRRLAAEMERRLGLLATAGVRNIGGYNAGATRTPLPYIVAVIDELAMLPTADVEALLKRLASVARKVGIHIVAATQRPDVTVVSGLIKANMPSRGALKVTSGTDSRVSLDIGGADKLLGLGDMLILPYGASVPLRVQAALVTDQEVEDVVAWWRAQGLVATGWPTADGRVAGPVSEANRDLAVAALAVIHDWADRHADRIVTGRIEGDPVAAGKVGHRRDDGSLALLPEPVRAELRNVGMDPEEVIRAWIEHGITQRGEGGNLLPKVYFGPEHRRKRLVVLPPAAR